jgi:hypothetical protein
MNRFIVCFVLFAVTAPDLFADGNTLAVFDAAGMPPENLPPAGAVLDLRAEETPGGTDDWALCWGGVKVGYLPARFRLPMEELLRGGVRMRLEVAGHHEPLRPGRFLVVSLRAFPRFPGEDLPGRFAEEPVEFELSCRDLAMTAGSPDLRE